MDEDDDPADKNWKGKGNGIVEVRNGRFCTYWQPNQRWEQSEVFMAIEPSGVRCCLRI